MQLPITEKEISQWTDAPVYSPVLCASLDYLGMDTKVFIDFFKSCFAEIPWDMYDVKRRQWAKLPDTVKAKSEEDFKSYYLDNKASFDSLALHLNLDTDTAAKLKNIEPWRRRSVCSFELTMGENIDIRRVYSEAFEQALGDTDIRSLPRIFEETKTEVVDNELFYSFLRAIANYAQKITPHIDIQQMKMTAHFMSVKAKQGVPGDNSPEGAHEDGADFIVSALVINRAGIVGGKSQVFEKIEDKSLVNIFERELQAGEFLFQADTGEEKHYGNDLWHYVTPFYVEGKAEEAWRDIIGLDIVIL